MMNKFGIFFFIFLLFPFISAGLIVENNSYNINKTFEENQNIEITIKNTENFSFYNINFKDNDFISMNSISALSGGESITFNASFFGNEPLTNKEIKIVGNYNSSVGENGITHIVEIRHDSPMFNPLNLNIIKGDSIKWLNIDEIYNLSLYKSNPSSELIYNIPRGSDFTMIFNEVGDYSYYSSYSAGIQGGVDIITVLSDSGLVHNSNYDGNIFINSNIDYPQTTLIISYLSSNNYDLNVFENTEGFIIIKNTGIKPAYISNDCDWFTFDKNSMVLEGGDDIVINYEIYPDVQYTNETNKNYIKNLSIVGNFPTINKTFNLFVNYANIDEGQTGGNSIIYLITQYCTENPNASFCEQSPKIIYKNVGDSGNLSQEQFKKLIDFWYINFNEVKDSNNWMKEQILNISNNYQIVKTNIMEVNNKIKEDDLERTNNFSFLYGIIFCVLILIISFIIYNLIVYYRENNNLKGVLGKIRGIRR